MGSGGLLGRGHVRGNQYTLANYTRNRMLCVQSAYMQFALQKIVIV